MKQFAQAWRHVIAHSLFVGLIATLSVFGAGGEKKSQPGSKAPSTDKTPPFNSQLETTPFLPPQQALEKIRLPEGFRANLFAAEPDVRQPIGIATDSRGRLWVAENYTYAQSSINYDLRFKDRIIIIEDANHDGRAEKRTVFWDQAQRLTSVEVGLGGVWAMAPPYLLFIPDRDGDDRPDGEPIIMLDGWDDSAARHNFTNGLRFGPDGWLYGRNGILATSWVGRPGDPKEKRTPMACGMWRFHPTTKKFEVVCTGTTNPWGHDWDENNELFFINTVIGHLWHVVPGAHYRRMYGTNPNPHVYHLIEQTADHFHWDTAEHWADIRKTGVTPTTDQAGGGHAHSGLMIYQGDNWPAEYRGNVFTVNLHGRRLNRDRIERQGATFVGKHAPDFCRTDDLWFRGIDLISGNDGGVFVADWSDIGECHENDGVHRDSGRIYKLTYGQPRKPDVTDVAKLSNEKLADLLKHENGWYPRQARLEIQKRGEIVKEKAALASLLNRRLAQATSSIEKLRILTCLQAVDGISDTLTQSLLHDPDERLRVAAVRLISDSCAVSGKSPTSATLRSLVDLATVDKSGLVLTYLASILQRVSPADRWDLAGALASRSEFANDRVFPLMVWYGVESATPVEPEKAASIAASAKLPIVRKFITRRLSLEIERDAKPLDTILSGVRKKGVAEQRDVLAGMAEAFKGWHRAPAPKTWEQAKADFVASPDADVRRLATDLSVVFGDGRALDEVRKIVRSTSEDPQSRRRAIRTLAESRADGIIELLTPLFGDADVAAEAVRGVAAFPSENTPKVLVSKFNNMRADARDEAVTALASRPAWAKHLLDAVEAKRIARSNVGVFLVRQMQETKEQAVRDQLARLWPELRPISQDKKARIAQLKTMLTSTPARAVDLAKGETLWTKHCATCHTLFGKGGKIGPDITGSQRGNLDYLLENIVDPSATLAAEFRKSILEMKDGRTIVGVVLSKNEQTMEVQTATDKVTLRRVDVENVQATMLSLMPDGLLDVLSEEELRSLMAYVMSPGR